MPSTRRRHHHHKRRTHKHHPLKVYQPVSYIKPGTDFYGHINGRWLKHMKIPADRPAVAIVDEMQREINIDLQALIRRAMVRPQNADERAIGEFAKSFMSPERKNHVLETLKSQLNDFGCMKTYEDVCKYVGVQLYNNNVPSIFGLYDGPEDTNSSHWRFHLSNGQLLLPDAAYYKGDVEGGKKFYEAYKHELEELGKKLGYAGLGEFADMEAGYANYINKGYDEDSKIYTGAELARAYPAIQWDIIWSQFGYDRSTWSKMIFVVDAPSWMKHVNHMFRTYTVDMWRTWMRAKYILTFGKYLSDDYRNGMDSVFFDLVGLQIKKMPVKEELLIVIKKFMNLELSRAYKETIRSATFRAEVRDFVISILDAAQRRLRASTWMRPATKATAIDKLDKASLGILYPTKSIDYTPPRLGPNLLENIMILGRAEIKKMMRDVAKKTTGQIWDNPVFVVNAYYRPAGNRIILPAAIVSPPFYDRKGSLGAKYGALGCVIGHEITHSFDTNGKDYDARGNRRNWWSAADNRAYNKRTAALEKLYNKERLLGRHIDGEQTLSENIADLEGMAISLDALKFELDRAKVSDEARHRELRDFFMAYATSWREKARVEKQQLNLVVDVHSPAKYRVNNIVRHFQEWYDVFDVREDDGLYLAPDERISIF